MADAWWTRRSARRAARRPGDGERARNAWPNPLVSISEQLARRQMALGRSLQMIGTRQAIRAHADQAAQERSRRTQVARRGGTGRRRPPAGMSAKTKKPMTRADKVIAFAHKYVRIPEGEFVGQPLRLEPFQERFIREIYDSPVPVHAILSIARKNAKTATIMVILLAHIAGPEAIENSQIASGAMSREQAAVLSGCSQWLRTLWPMLTNHHDCGRFHVLASYDEQDGSIGTKLNRRSPG